MLLFQFFLCFLSQGVLFTSVATPLYLYFIAFVVPSKVLMEVSARFGFLCRTYFSVSHFVRHAQERSSYVYATFVQLEFFDLSNRSASKKFVFTDCSVLTDSAFYLHSLFYCVCVVFFAPQNISGCS